MWAGSTARHLNAARSDRLREQDEERKRVEASTRAAQNGESALETGFTSPGEALPIEPRHADGTEFTEKELGRPVQRAPKLTTPQMDAVVDEEIARAAAPRNGTVSLSPAYGRDYKSKDAVIADFDKDKDFIVEGLHSGGTYANKSGLTNFAFASIRYAEKRKVVRVDLRDKPVTAAVRAPKRASFATILPGARTQ